MYFLLLYGINVKKINKFNECIENILSPHVHFFKKLLYLKNISKYKNKFIVLIFYNIILIKNVLYWKYVNIKNTMSYRNSK